MGLQMTDADDVTTEHIPDRLEVNLLAGGGRVEDLEVKIYFKIKTILPNGKVVGQPYLDNNFLLLNCKENAKLTEAMKVIQEAIGEGRHQQMIKLISELSENSEMSPLEEV